MIKNKLIHYEILTNQVLGIIAGWLVLYFIFPYLLVFGKFWMATISSTIFFIISYVRLYFVRLFFKKIERKRYEARRNI